MEITDRGTQQALFVLSSVVLVVFIICLCVVGFRLAEAWGEKSNSKSIVESEIARAAEAKAREAEMYAKKTEMEYQKALLERVGTIPTITVNLPQEQLDKLALDSVKRRIESLKVVVEL